MLEPPELHAQFFDVTKLEENNTISVPMESNGDNTNRLTIFDIIESGQEPIVNLRRTVEGEVVGPHVRFLGSVASKEALRLGPTSIAAGRVIGGYILVVADKKTGKHTTLTGRVDTTLPVSVSDTPKPREIKMR